MYCVDFIHTLLLALSSATSPASHPSRNRRDDGCLMSVDCSVDFAYVCCPEWTISKSTFPTNIWNSRCQPLMMRTATKHSLLIQITSTYGHAIHLCSWDCPIRCALFRIDNHFAPLSLNASLRCLIGQIVYMHLVRTNGRLCTDRQPGLVREVDGGAFPRCRPADRRARVGRYVGQQPPWCLDHCQGE